MAHSRLISPPQWLIDMLKCPTISPDGSSAKFNSFVIKAGLEQRILNETAIFLSPLSLFPSFFEICDPVLVRQCSTNGRFFFVCEILSKTRSIILLKQTWSGGDCHWWNIHCIHATVSSVRAQTMHLDLNEPFKQTCAINVFPWFPIPPTTDLQITGPSWESSPELSVVAVLLSVPWFSTLCCLELFRF